MSSKRNRRKEEVPLRYTKNHWNRIFNTYDHDHDGKIPISQFTLELTRDNNIDRDVLEDLLRKADENGDDFITFPEFYQLIKSREGTTVKRIFSNYIIHTIPGRRQIVRSDEIDGEYEEEYSCTPPTLCMIIVSLIEIGVFIFDFYNQRGANVTNTPASHLFIYNPHRRKEAWRFLTYMFVHVGFFHLLVNVVVQLLLGIPLEMVHGWWRVLVIYLAGVCAGSLGTSIADPSVYLAGASGGVYAIITAHIATLIMNWSEMQFAKWQLIVLLTLITLDVGSAVRNRYVLHVNMQIGYAAHLAGAIAGFLVGIYVLRNLHVRSWEKTLWWFALFLYLVLMVAGIVVNIVFPSYFPEQTV
ncbi:protein rhomboid [Cimex lectularius]|uniref:EF-hand domain-containing protein n=1 Tax=Cimex lectularius TaxID=79782 RepID=A0A8I6SST8_CIMLE|nr:protein rhomboid [Cimex lectularius]XP_014243643.1 protein rhomboid [Cimex lectularius]XP_024085211.1 protein rhomboid [Cimex lectularius]